MAGDGVQGVLKLLRNILRGVDNEGFLASAGLSDRIQVAGSLGIFWRENTPTTKVGMLAAFPAAAISATEEMAVGEQDVGNPSVASTAATAWLGFLTRAALA